MDILFTLAGLALLVVGAEVLVRGAVSLALRMRLSPLVVGLTVVSMGTSAPELVVSLAAALKGSPVIALANVVGSNIANITLILGASVLIFPIPVDRASWRVHTPVMVFASLLLILLLTNDQLARWEGGLLLGLLVAYVTQMVRAARRAHAVGSTPVPVGASRWWIAALQVVVGVATLVLGSAWFVDGASGLAKAYGLSEGLVGLTIVALGTSMPELVTSLVAAFRQQADISLGNLVGSNIFNILGILGITALVRPIALPHGAFDHDLWVMMGVAVLIYPLMRSGSRMGRWQGLVLLLSYGAYMALVVGRG